MRRREFLGVAAGALVAGDARAQSGSQALPFPVIDTHIHLFDPTRPQGVPWPSKDDAVLYKPALPDRYRRVAEPFGVAGAIEIEASPWLEDNQWVLDVAAKDKIIVGTIGDLEPGKPGFRAQLERFHRNPLFLGIRYGNLWGRNLAVEIAKPAFIDDLRALAAAGLVLDTANQTPELMAAAVRVTDAVPDLRIVIDHLPQLAAPADANLRELGKRPQVYAKVSEVLRRVNGHVPLDLAGYKPKLDEIFGIFGENRVLFGSDWPNSDNWAPYGAVFGVVREYFLAKGTAVAEKYFRTNSVKAYRWQNRS
ncbi:MAG TPA: amidohydrolase family protein [Bryobacteraceae bacterium]|nr:amidohydrolase family protein [Bryobacteraceae bacterium]